MQMLLGLANYRNWLKISSLSLSIMKMMCHFCFSFLFLIARKGNVLTYKG